MPRVPHSLPKKPGPYAPRDPQLLYRSQRQSPVKPAQLNPPAKPLADPVARLRSPAVIVASTLVFGIGVYVSSLYISSARAASKHHPTSLDEQKDVSAVYNKTAGDFDAEVGLSERLMGIMRTRKQLASQCSGDVLEVSAGTARNLGYYIFGRDEGEVRSLTLVDLSQEMVEQSKAKWEVLNKDGKKLRGSLGVQVRFMQGDAATHMPPPPAPLKTGAKKESLRHDLDFVKTGYDTIFQTMGLCSTPTPAELLRNLAKHLDPANPEAKILLLEHGRSYYEWMNRILDTHASKHADLHGCWWNRDIGEIVEESGLEVIKERRKHFGTTWLFELRPKKVIEPAKVANVEVAEVRNEQAASTTSSWTSWIPKWG